MLKLLRPDIPPTTTFSLLTLNNGTNIQGTSKDVVGIEANLDTQYTIGELRCIYYSIWSTYSIEIIRYSYRSACFLPFRWGKCQCIRHIAVGHYQFPRRNGPPADGDDYVLR